MIATTRKFKNLISSSALAAALIMAPNTYADELEVAEEPITSELEDALFGGEVKVNLRVRGELADVDGFKTSHALTERLRVGYGTKPYDGWSFYVEVEDIRAADDDRYNAAGTNDNPDYSVIADPEDTELNQAYVLYNDEYSFRQLKIGRQRITLDDQRFVGNVGWRQNEQTFDAATLISTDIENVRLIYTFIWDINRILGPDADADLTSESHVVNITLEETPVGQVTVFGYFLDVDDQPFAAGASSDTYGIRITGDTPINDEYDLEYIFSIAQQVDAGDNPTDYDATYLLVEGKVHHDPCFIGLAYELLGSDDGKFGFQTPLATGHKFNGWADVFLTTPSAGLQDIYIYAGSTLPNGIKFKTVLHEFFTHEDRQELGRELDVVMSKKITDNVTVLAKYANFDGKSGLSDVQKATLETTIDF